MQLEELQMAANRAWRIHLVRSLVFAWILVIGPITERPKLGFLAMSNPTLIWAAVLFYVALVAYCAEWTRYEWHQLQAIKKLRSVPSDDELRIARAKEKLRYSMMTAALLFCLFGCGAWMLLSISSNRFNLMLYTSLAAALGALGPVWRATRALRLLTSHPS
jgi:hypothetical protein